MALRRAVLSHVRLPVQTLTLNGSKQQLWTLRFMSSHDDHINKEEVIERVLSVVKSFPKVDPAQVGHSIHQKIYTYIYNLFSILCLNAIVMNIFSIKSCII